MIAIVEPEQVTFRRRGQDEVVVATADAKSELERQLSARAASSSTAATRPTSRPPSIRHLMTSLPAPRANEYRNTGAGICAPRTPDRAARRRVGAPPA